MSEDYNFEKSIGIRPLPKEYEDLKDRGISAATAKRFGVGQSEGEHVYPYFDKDGQHVANKIRRVYPKGFRWEGSVASSTLFGQNIFPQGNGGAITIVEGECFRGDTEVLTESGWISLSSWNGERVHQVNSDLSGEFIQPIGRTIKYYADNLIRYTTKGWSSLTTPEHNLVSITQSGHLVKHKANHDIRSWNNIPRAVNYHGPGLNLSDEQLKYCVAVSADASFDKRVDGSTYVRFSVRKQRKIDRFKSILDSLGLDYVQSVHKSGSTFFGLTNPEWAIERHFPGQWIGELSDRQRLLILHELVHWDGNSVPNRNQTEYSSKNYDNAVFVQTLCHLSGFCSSIISRKNQYGEWFKVSLLWGKTQSSWQGVITTTEPHNGMVYCLTVPSGMLLIRTDGKISVSGNCDAMAAYEITGSRYPVVSVHSAGSAPKNVAENFEYLNSFDKIVVCFDKDEPKVNPQTGLTTYPGQEAALKVAAMFPIGKVRLLTLQEFKDPNEYLAAGRGAQFIKEWFSAPVYTPSGLKLGKNMWDEIRTPKNTKSISYPWQGLQKKTYGIRPSEVVIITAETGVGKALALDTPIPTPDGWLTMGELKPGHIIYDDKGLETKVTFVTPTQYNRKCYRVNFSDGASVVADADHNWLVYDRYARAHRREGSVLTTEQLIDNLLVSGGARNYAIPYGRIEGADRDLPCDPYHLGLWLGDGSSTSSSFYTNDDLHLAFEGKYLVKKQPFDKYGWTIHGLSADIRLAGCFGNKHIPHEYLRASFDQRLELLKGLMDTDGSCSDRGSSRRCEFTSARKILAEGVYELCLSLGIQATIKEGRAMIDGRDCGPKWRIGFTTGTPVFKLKRKLDKQGIGKDNRYSYRMISSIDPVESVPVKCIQVDSPSHMFLCGRDMIPTHNTSILREIEAHILNESLEDDTKPGIGLLHLEEPNSDTALGLMSVAANKPLHLPDVRELVDEKELREYYDKTVNTDRIVIWDHFGSNSIHEVLSKIRHMANLGCKYIVVDHLSIIVSDQSGDERKQLDEISTKLKTLCMELNIAVIAVIHQNRQGQIRGTAGVEQLANIVLKLSRDIESPSEWRRNITKVLVQKNRFCGITGPGVYLFYDPITARLTELNEDEIRIYEEGGEPGAGGELPW